MNNLHKVLSSVHDCISSEIPNDGCSIANLKLFGGVNFMVGDIDDAKSTVRHSANHYINGLFSYLYSHNDPLG